MFIILLFVTIALLTALISGYYRKNWSKNFSISIEFSKNGIFEGEKTEIKQVFTNRKMLPVWWGDVKFQVPGELKFDDTKVADRNYFHKDAVSIWPYEKVTRTLPFTAQRRGYYTVNTADFLTYDMFFSLKFIKVFPQSSELYVYPDIKRVESLDIDYKKIVGEIVKKRHIIEDPFQFRGIRDYYPFDSLKTVNWNATAKTGEMKVNQYHYTSSQEVVLLLDFDGYNIYDSRSVKEDLIRVTAFLAGKLIGNGISVGLLSNACSVTGEEINIPCKNGLNQNLFILKTLSKLQTDKLKRPFDLYLKDLLTKKDTRPQYILLSYYGGESLQQRADEIRFNGMSLHWVLLKEKDRKMDIKNHNDLYLCEVIG